MVKLFGGLIDSNEKEIKRLQQRVDEINGLEADFAALSDEELRAKTAEFKMRLKDGETLDDLLPEAFAAVREAARRTLHQRHYDVQLIGGMVLHEGKIAEMKTGEGKTLVATLPLYLNSLTGEGVHLVTVNDYLARRDPYWMGPVYHALGVSVASIYPMQANDPGEHTPARLFDPAYDATVDRAEKLRAKAENKEISAEELKSALEHLEHDPWRHFRPIPRKEAYQADITYGTSAEFGFDYLRDNMVVDLRNCVQGNLKFAIVDEVDNLLIDEARTPLIISGPDEEASQLYSIFANLVPQLKLGKIEEDGTEEGDYGIDEKARSASLTNQGIDNVERMLARERTAKGEPLLKSPNLYDDINHSLVRHLESALKAYAVYKRDVDYVVKDTSEGKQVIIVDPFTGRLMFGRRYSEGLHQALEAKERVRVQPETKTYATITIQNYFRMYDKLGGMTGTALTEAEEFSKIYELEVVVIPTNKPMVREDKTDVIYKDEAAKFKAVVSEITELNKKGQPVLVGTVSVEKSEELSEMLKRRGVPYQVLNAKLHEKEAGIIAEAGKPGAVTIATNMAGRGVDIILGGRPPENGDGKARDEWQARHNKVLELGGLYVMGTERHEARRIDNQLRGRSGRQGDPGTTRFYVSLEDDIVRRFGGDRMKGMLERLGMDEDTPIENRFINRAIEDVQKRVEGYHFDMRKHLVEFDDVVNTQRKVIYAERQKILGGADLRTHILSVFQEEVRSLFCKEGILAVIGDEVKSLLAAHYSDGEPNIGALIRDASQRLPLPPWFNEDFLSRMSEKEVEERLTDHARSLYQQWSRDAERGVVDETSQELMTRFVMPALIKDVPRVFSIAPRLDAVELAQLKPTELEDKINDEIEAVYVGLEKEIGADNMRTLERRIMLSTMDRLWIDHLTFMENMRQQAGLDTLRQMRAEDAYKISGERQWQELLSAIQSEMATTISRVAIVKKEAPKPMETPMARVAPAQGSLKKAAVKPGGGHVGRNDPCPCGSGKKYKKCCGK